MPLYPGSDTALQVNLVDTPGINDLTVDRPGNSSTEKVVREVQQRIDRHNSKTTATMEGYSLIEEQQCWNELVHVCFFFIAPHELERSDVEYMRRLHRLVPLVVLISKSDTMTVEETHLYKAKVAKQLADEGIETFSFSQEKRMQVEEWHKSLVATDFSAEDAFKFQPLYGGSQGDEPWAVMGADNSVREMIIGRWMTDNPYHSDLPAVRDLILRAGGWQDLKNAAARKAEREGRRLRESAKLGWSRKLRMSIRRPSIAQLLIGLLVLVAAMLNPQHNLAKFKMASMKSEHQSEVTRLKSEQTRLKSEHQSEVARLESEHQSEVARLESEHQSEVARLESVASSLRSGLKECKERRDEHQSEVTRLKSEQTRLKSEQTRLKSEHQSEVTRLESEHQSEVARLKSVTSSLRSGLKECKERRDADSFILRTSLGECKQERDACKKHKDSCWC